MLANTLKSKVQIQEKTITQGALGQTVVWKPVSNYFARVLPLDVRAIASYQQLNTVVTQKVLLRGIVTIELGKYRLLHGSKIYEPASSAKHLDKSTEIVVKEV